MDDKDRYDRYVVTMTTFCN